MLLPSTLRDTSAFTWPAALFVWGPGSWSDRHRHHSVQLVMALQGTLRFRESTRQPWTRCGGVLVKPDAWHEVDARGTDVLVAFVEPESELGAALRDRARCNVEAIARHTIASWRAQLGRPASLASLASLTASRVEPWVRQTLLSDGGSHRLDHRITRVVKSLPGRLADADAVSLPALAATVGLSPSRFMHVFSEGIGVPLRQYVLWLRLQCGAAELARGKSVTDAAHDAGFSDAAHFSRTFRRMIGATPRQILQRGLAARDFHL